MTCNRETVSGWESFSYATTTKSLQITPKIEEATPTILQLYPNPLTNGQLYVSGISDNSTLSIYNMGGLLVLETSVNSNTQSVDLSSINQGIYTIVINGGENSIVTKLVIK